MNTVQLVNRIAAGALAAVMAVGAVSSAVFADEAYNGYNYDWWGDPVPSQNGYIVDTVISGTEMGVGNFNSLNDIFVDDETGLIYLTDKGNNRIVITDESFDPEKTKVLDTFKYGTEFPESKSTIKQTTLKNPSATFVIHNDGKTLIYIADYDNDRVLACYEDGTIFMEYTRPSSDLFAAEYTFKPSNVCVDNALNVYVVIKSITSGMVQFSDDGNFNGYYGANRVEKTAEVIANTFWKLVMSREQYRKMARSVAVEIGNVDIDEEGFIYTVTGTKNSETDVLKKLNPAGENVYTNMGYDGYVYGDYTYYDGKNNHSSGISDVDIDANKNVFLLDTYKKRVFQYSDELDLEFIFGGEGYQKGLFLSPTAIENLNGKVYVTDGRKNSITVFKLTEFGELVQEAVALFNRGLYDEAKVPFEEVIKRDSNYWFAYIGLGNAYYTDGDYETAMDYFYMHSRGGYNRAFKEYRINFIRSNFNVFIIAIVAVIVLLVVLTQVHKYLKKKKSKAGGKK